MQIVTDSPILQSAMMMITDPMFLTSSGGTLATVGGQKALIEYKPKKKRGELKIVVNNQYLVTIEGKKITQEDLEAYAKAIDYKKLADLQ